MDMTASLNAKFGGVLRLISHQQGVVGDRFVAFMAQARVAVSTMVPRPSILTGADPEELTHVEVHFSPAQPPAQPTIASPAPLLGRLGERRLGGRRPASSGWRRRSSLQRTEYRAPTSGDLGRKIMLKVQTKIRCLIFLQPHN